MDKRPGTGMSDQLSESELLAYVEDELDAKDASALRARLAEES